MRWSGAVLVLTACGRLGFEPLDGGSPSDAAAPPDYCAALPALGAPPAIDGVLERGAPLAPIEPVDWSGTEPLPAGVSAVAAIAWWEDGLYFFVDVTDPDRFVAARDDYPWCGDGVEIYADSDGLYPDAPSYDDPGTRQLIARAPLDDATPEVSGRIYRDASELGEWPSGFMASPRPGGYTLEAIVTRERLGLAGWTLAEGGTVGVNLSVNVSFDSDRTGDDGTLCAENHRLGQYFMRVDDDPSMECVRPWCNAAAFCTAVLQ